MKINCIRIQNFRRLKNTRIDFDPDISIFVGANNSGKTSVAHALDMFVNGGKEKFSIYDFTANCWEEINKIGDDPQKSIEEKIELPPIRVDLWFEIKSQDTHRVLDILPGLEWNGSVVGLRLQFQPRDTAETLTHYMEAKAKGSKHIPKTPDQKYKPWPKNLIDFLGKNLTQEYEIKYYALDINLFDQEFNEKPSFSARPLPIERGKSLVKSLIKVNILHAQRHLSDQASNARAEDLSKCLSRFYKRNLEKRDEDHDALSALYESEEQFNAHLKNVFGGTLNSLGELGYPGVLNPHLIIKSALNPTNIMNQDTRVHYSLGGKEESLTLPDNYNGLGFKNLIYMVVELLDIKARWMEEEDEKALLQLVVIEEPEAHLHAQLQQVFIRKIWGILEVEGEDAGYYNVQLAITTHSPHILYERGLKSIRYFRRQGERGPDQHSVSLNLSDFYSREPFNDFLERYMKLTHCDLFFADAAILVEGNVERILLPLMIQKCAEDLNSSYISILEVGGAYAYRFKRLIEFLGLPTLVITDLDSVLVKADSNEEEADEIEIDVTEETEQQPKYLIGKACRPNKDGAITSNQTLVKWLPQKSTIRELLDAPEESLIQVPTDETPAIIRVAYQNEVNISWKEEHAKIVARTLEETFALENAEWCQDNDRKHLGLKIRKQPATIDELADKIHRKVEAGSFNKTGFALGVLSEDQTQWQVPSYIKIGLEWLLEKLKDREEIKELSPDMPNSEQIEESNEVEND